MSVDGADERGTKIEARERRRRKATQSFELLGRNSFPASQLLRCRDRLPHIHTGAEDFVARTREHGATNLVILGDAAPCRSELVKHRWVERVGLLRAVESDYRHVRMLVGEREANRHDCSLKLKAKS
jgi:hypothetical protein